MPRGTRDLRPDVAVVTDERAAGPLDPRGWIEGAPSIAIEVLSPSTEARDRGLKSRRYFEEGAAEYWTFDSLRRTAAFRHRGASGWIDLPAKRSVYRTRLLPGFKLDLTALWRELGEILGAP